MISAVLATLNEARSCFLPFVLQSLERYPEIEVVAVDGGSKDDTVSLLKKAHLKLIEAPGASFAERCNMGIKACMGSMILLQHPQSLIENEGLGYLLDHEEELDWGGFRLRYENKNPMLGFNSWYSNELRGRRRGLLTFEHCLFFKRNLLPSDQPAVPVVGIYEATALSARFREKRAPQVLPFFATASTSQFIEEGVFNHTLRTQAAKLSSALGVELPELLKPVLEKRKKSGKD